MMYSKIRTIHLCSAMLSLAFLVMYTVSAVQMAHSKWFNLKPSVSERTVSVTPGITDARVAARELVARGLDGELRAIQSATPERLVFRIVRPGTVYDVTYTAATGASTVKTSTAGFMGYLNRLHHIEGLWHEYGLLNVWAGFIGLISVALFLMGGSGLYLWFQNHRERRIGGVLLTVAVLFTGAVIVSMRMG